MDKQTLSNYGWIVVTVLVLAVMLALATPFGEFIAGGFKATYTGFSHVTDKALGVIGLGNGGNGGGDETPDVPAFDLGEHKEHMLGIWDDGNPGVHSVYCKDCDTLITKEAPHTDANKDEKCDDCFAFLGTTPETPDTPDVPAFDLGEHENHYIVYQNNGDGATHLIHCKECDVILADKEAHRDNICDMFCDDCGANLDPYACEHSNKKYADNGDGTHDIICGDCGEITKPGAAHRDRTPVDGFCDYCDANMGAPVCQHYNVKYTDNGDGTHNGNCADCGETTITNEAHYNYNGDNKCDNCDYEYPWSIKTEFQNYGVALYSLNAPTLPYGAVNTPVLKAETVYAITKGYMEGTWYWEDINGTVYEGSPTFNDYENGLVKTEFCLYDADKFEATAKKYCNIDDNMIAQMRNLTGSGMDGNFAIYDGENYIAEFMPAGGTGSEFYSYVDNGGDNYDVYGAFGNFGGNMQPIKMNVTWNGSYFVVNNITLLASEFTGGENIW